MKKAIENNFKESIQVKQDTLVKNDEKIIAVVKAMVGALKKNRKIR